MKVIDVHGAELCAGRPCCIHNPSDHHMRGWPLHWRSDRYLMERTCPHGVGHPDPDHLVYVETFFRDFADRSAQRVHGCDGCCNKEKTT